MIWSPNGWLVSTSTPSIVVMIVILVMAQLVLAVTVTEIVLPLTTLVKSAGEVIVPSEQGERVTTCLHTQTAVTVVCELTTMIAGFAELTPLTRTLVISQPVVGSGVR